MLELDYNQHLVSTFLCLSGRFYWKSHLLPLVWSCASSKWEMAHFLLHFPFKIHRECLAVFKPSPDQKAQHRLNPQPKGSPVIQPSAAALASLHWHHKFYLFSESVTETLLPTSERTHNFCWSFGCLIMRNFSLYGRTQAVVSLAQEAKTFSNFQPGRRGVSLKSINQLLGLRFWYPLWKR